MRSASLRVQADLIGGGRPPGFHDWYEDEFGVHSRLHLLPAFGEGAESVCWSEVTEDRITPVDVDLGDAGPEVSVEGLT